MSARNSWRLSQPAFDRLLDTLGPDRERAGETYESLRARLIRYFQWRGSNWPEDDADETFDRVVRRLEDGEVIERLEKYVHGVSRLVALESRREWEKEQASRWPAAYEGQAARADGAGEALQGHLDRCLVELPPADRELILDYYRGDPEDRIESRKTLADRLGLPLTVLRLRAHRIRSRLESCLQRQLGTVGSRGARKTTSSVPSE